MTIPRAMTARAFVSSPLCSFHHFQLRTVCSVRQILMHPKSASPAHSLVCIKPQCMTSPGRPSQPVQTSAFPRVKIRPAVLADVPILTQWDREPHVITAKTDDLSKPDKIDWESELATRDDGACFFIAEVNKRPIGMLGVIDPARERTKTWGAIAGNMRAIDIWIGERDSLGKGFGSQMMQWALAYCFQNPDVIAVVVDPLYSNQRAQRFYERFGFRKAERRQFDACSDCYVMRLERNDNKIAENDEKHDIGTRVAEPKLRRPYPRTRDTN